MEIKWVAVAVAGIFFGVVCGLLGLTIGIYFNPESTITFVPVWGSLGDWASAIGAFSAVAFALWQSHRQQQKELPRVKIINQFTPDECLLRVVSEGIVPESVLGAELIFKKDGSKIDLLTFSRIPKGGQTTKLQRGEYLDILALNKHDLLQFIEQWVARPIDQMRRSEIYPGNGYFKLNKVYFDRLEEFFKQDLEILIRLVSKDVMVKVPPEFLSVAKTYVINTRKTEETERAASRNGEARARYEAGLHLEYGDPET